MGEEDNHTGRFEFAGKTPSVAFAAVAVALGGGGAAVAVALDDSLVVEVVAAAVEAKPVPKEQHNCRTALPDDYQDKNKDFYLASQGKQALPAYSGQQLM